MSRDHIGDHTSPPHRGPHPGTTGDHETTQVTTPGPTGTKQRVYVGTMVPPQRGDQSPNTTRDATGNGRADHWETHPHHPPDPQHHTHPLAAIGIPLARSAGGPAGSGEFEPQAVRHMAAHSCPIGPGQRSGLGIAYPMNPTGPGPMTNRGIPHERKDTGWHGANRTTRPAPTPEAYGALKPVMAGRRL